MIIKISLGSILFLTSILSNCQSADEYQVFALKYIDGRYISAQQVAIGANPKDSVRLCNMFWLLKGANGRNILADAGFIDTTKTGIRNYVRPDLVLQRMHIAPSDITDIIITHPHNDHIGGINLFPRAQVWMQQDDFDYFIGEAWQKDGFSRGFHINDVRNIIGIKLQGRLTLVKGDNIEIIPGIKVFIGSKHSYENQYLLVNSNSAKNKVLLASDAIWAYYNFDNLIPATLCMDQKAYTEAMKRMKTLVSNPNSIIPGHDDQVFSKFPEISKWIVKIGN